MDWSDLVIKSYIRSFNGYKTQDYNLDLGRKPVPTLYPPLNRNIFFLRLNMYTGHLKCT